MKRHLGAPDNTIALISSGTLGGMPTGSLRAGAILCKFGIKNTLLGIHIVYALANGVLFFMGKNVMPPLTAMAGSLGALPLWTRLLTATVPMQLASIPSAARRGAVYCPDAPLCRTLDLNRLNRGLVIGGILALYLLLAALTGGFAVLLTHPRLPWREQQAVRVLREGPLSAAAVLIPSVLLLAPGGEEFCCRYALDKKLAHLTGPRTGAAPTAIVSAAVRLNAPAFPALCFLRGRLTFPYRRTGSAPAPARFNVMTIIICLVFAVWGRI